MKKEDLKQFINLFIMIRAGQVGNKKTMHGYIREMDSRGNLWFEDLEGFGLVFKCEDVDSVELKEFRPMPEKYNGKDIYWNGGRVYYKKTNKECDLDGSKVIEPPAKKVNKPDTESLYQVFFCVDDKWDYVIIGGDSIERIKNTALDVITQRGLDIVNNFVYSERIPNS